jgi:hypothetical protein
MLKPTALITIGGLFHHPLFHLVFQILGNKFLNPPQFVIRPALRMEGEHHPGGEIACFKGCDDVGGGMVAAAQETVKEVLSG